MSRLRPGRRVLTAVLLGAAVLGSGCLPSSPGALNQGGFTYLCTDSSDVTCDGDLLKAAVPPGAIAVGGTFDLTYTANFSLTPNTSDPVTVVPASPGLAEPSAGGFTVEAAGESAFLARTASGTVDDFTTLYGVPVDHLSLPSNLEVEVGQPQLVRVYPEDAAGNTLGGAIQYTWVSSAPDVIQVDGNEGAVSLEAFQEGSATITVEGAGASASINVTVPGSAP